MDDLSLSVLRNVLDDFWFFFLCYLVGLCFMVMNHGQPQGATGTNYGPSKHKNADNHISKAKRGNTIPNQITQAKLLKQRDK